MIVLALAAPSSALADDCIYSTGLGPSLTRISGKSDALRINFGDWSETCALKPGNGAPPGFGFGSGWANGQIAICKKWRPVVSYVFAGGADSEIGSPVTAITLNGNTFYRDPACKP